MDLFCEVANIHMIIDAKNQVTTVRTIHVIEHKENHPHDLCVVRERFVQETFTIFLRFQPKIVWQTA